MNEFIFRAPTRIIFGAGKIRVLPDVIREFGNKVAIICGIKFLKEKGYLGEIEKILKSGNIVYKIFAGVPAEPTPFDVDFYLSKCREFEPDVICGIGGGSVLDTAKAVAGLMYADGKSSDYLEKDGFRKVEKEGVPFIAVPTTAGTGSEVTNNSVLKNPETKRKRSIRSDFLFAKYAILDPDFLIYCPVDVALSAGMDALCHAVEAYLSVKASPLSDAYAEKCFELFSDSFAKVLTGKGDVNCWGKLLLGSMCAGVAFLNAGLCLIHSLSGIMGGLIEIPHGVVNALLLPGYVEFEKDVEKMKHIIKIFGKNNFAEEFIKISGVRWRFSQFGLTEKEIKILLEEYSRRNDPKEIRKEDVLRIIKRYY